ncbi:unnamed protein product [Parajaminaea phylloscopi]
MAQAEKWLFEARLAEVSPGVKISYIDSLHTATADAEDRAPAEPFRTILLVHGYPQTMYSMRHLSALLVEQGFRVVCADYRGAGGSSMPVGGYDKWTMAEDLHLLMTSVLGCTRYAVLGHDIGSMVATAQALRYRDHVSALVCMECPQPGTQQYALSITDPKMTQEKTFHFFFHTARDLPEQLTHGREDVYLDHFFDRLAFKPHFLTDKERSIYHNAFARSGRMRAGFELYRAFTQDDADVKSSVVRDGKLDIPVLATGGEHSAFTEGIASGAQEYANNVVHVAVPDANHWVPEENAEGLAREVSRFLYDQS